MSLIFHADSLVSSPKLNTSISADGGLQAYYALYCVNPRFKGRNKVPTLMLLKLIGPKEQTIDHLVVFLNFYF